LLIEAGRGRGWDEKHGKGLRTCAAGGGKKKQERVSVLPPSSFRERESTGDGGS